MLSAEEAQITEPVRFCVAAIAKDAVAVNSCGCPQFGGVRGLAVAVTVHLLLVGLSTARTSHLEMLHMRLIFNISRGSDGDVETKR